MKLHKRIALGLLLIVFFPIWIMLVLNVYCTKLGIKLRDWLFKEDKDAQI